MGKAAIIGGVLIGAGISAAALAVRADVCGPNHTKTFDITTGKWECKPIPKAHRPDYQNQKRQTIQRGGLVKGQFQNPLSAAKQRQRRNENALKNSQQRLLRQQEQITQQQSGEQGVRQLQRQILQTEIEREQTENKLRALRKRLLKEQERRQKSVP